MCSVLVSYTPAVLDVGGVYRRRGVKTHSFKKSTLKVRLHTVVVKWLYKTVQNFFLGEKGRERE